MNNQVKSQPFSVRIFMPGGDPDGVKIIERSNWTGCGVLAPRTLFSDSRKRHELARTGVYILVGSDDQSELPRVYIGEGDPIKPRLESHYKNKNFWTHMIGFTSKDQNLHKAHIQYLESRLISLAQKAKRCVLDNSVSPKLPSLSEADQAEVEDFLTDVLLCLTVLGYGYFDSEVSSEANRVEYKLSSKGITANGYESSKGFVVLEKSQIIKNEATSIRTHLSNLRCSLVEQGVLIDRGDYYELSQDYTFNSASTAAGMVLARSANGRIEWKTEDGRTLKSIQEEEVENQDHGDD